MGATSYVYLIQVFRAENESSQVELDSIRIGSARNTA